MAFAYSSRKRLVYGVAALTFAAMVWITSLPQVSMPECPNRLLQEFSTAFAQYQRQNAQKTHAAPLNLNPGTPSGKVLVLTPFKQAEQFLPYYFQLLEETTYPKELLSVGFLVSDTTDDTIPLLIDYANQYSFANFKIFTYDFSHYVKQNGYEAQLKERSILAQARNLLLSSALETDTEYVAWIDPNMLDYPTTIFEDLIKINVDVVTPNIMMYIDGNATWGFDRNNWQETEQSIKYQQGLENEVHLVEGHKEVTTGRKLLVDIRSNSLTEKVPLDGIGGSFMLVKADIHRQGGLFPAYLYKHQVDTEGFAKVAKDMGFQVYGLPGYHVYHN